MRAIRIVGDNAGPLTGTGTNTWLIPGREPTLVDASEDSDAYADRVAETLESAQPGATLERLLVTHAHSDHIGGAGAIVRRWPDVSCEKIPAARDAETGIAWKPLKDDDIVKAGDGVLWVLHTPGHAPDHACFLDPHSAVACSGDLLINGATVTIPVSSGGNLRQYLRALRRLLDLQPRQLLPGHGPAIEQPAALIRGYLGHRQLREQQIVEALEQESRTREALVERIYQGLDEALKPAAAENVLAHLIKLEEDGRVAQDGDRWTLIPARI